MATNPCYSGPNPVTDDERYVIWKWAKEHGGIDKGTPIENVADAINTQFFSGMAPKEWITDILSGRKTPFRQVANDMWRKQYNRRVIQQQARDVMATAETPAVKWLRRLFWLPRTVAVAGHGIVFPVTHAGDLIFRPSSWYTFLKGVLRTYRGAPELWGLGTKLGGGKGYVGRILDDMRRDSLFDTALRSKLDIGDLSHPSGLISRHYQGPAARAWDMLTVMRFELWKKQMGKFVKDGMSEAQVNEIGEQLAQWANNATGSGKGPIANLGGGKAGLLFGPKLTQAKLNRLTVDPAQTIKTFANWKEATPGEKAVAWTRLSGATQWAVTNLGFLAVNQGALSYFGTGQKINWTDPTKADWMAFKIPGIEGFVPGLHSEVKVLANILATAFASAKPPGWYPKWLADQAPEWHKELRGSKFRAVATIGGQYAMGKLSPTYQRGLELGLGQNWKGQPLPSPLSSEPGTAKTPKLTKGEYAADIGPIPLSGPIGFVYDHLKEAGASATDASAITKSLIIFGIGLPGVHVRAEPPEKAAPLPTTMPSMSQMIRQQQKAQGITPPPRTRKQLLKALQKQGP